MAQLVTWQRSSGRKPLILQGVRQTGKTYLLEQFGKRCFSNYHIINFERETGVRTLFDQDLDPVRIVNQLSVYLGKAIDAKRDLVIFDEIQACPRALTSLKYFCEGLPELALCSAGSLLGLHLNEGSFPVGKVDMQSLYPMTFIEFLQGVGDQQAVEYLRTLTLSSIIPDVLHQKIWERLKHYFITGGLPEVVATFASYDNLFTAIHQVREKQDSLIKAYYADIAKHAGGVDALHIDRTWRAIPRQLAEVHDNSSNRFKFKGIVPKVSRYSQLVGVIDWLNAAELVIKVPIVHHAELPLSAYTKENLFKLMMFDVGMLGAMGGLPPEAILRFDFGTYKGYFAENFVLQQLTACHNQGIMSWQKDKSEVEFVTQYGGDVVPIEVKSSHRTKVKSLEKFINNYQASRAVILSSKTIGFQPEKTVVHLPLYLAERVFELL